MKIMLLNIFSSRRCDGTSVGRRRADGLSAIFGAHDRHVTTGYARQSEQEYAATASAWIIRLADWSGAADGNTPTLGGSER